MNQSDRIMKYIHEFGSITSLDAFRDLGITRLSARIHELRESGVEFDMTREKAKNRYGEPVSYNRYSLKERK